MLLTLVASIALTQQVQTGGIRVYDLFDREVTTRGITLLDWDGQIANPAIQLRLELPADTQFPCEVYLHGTNDRIHFDRADAEDRTGVGRRMRLADRESSKKVRIAIFPDRDGEDEKHELVIQLFTPARTERNRVTLPVQVIDQDERPKAPLYPILLDYSEDRTGYFKSKEVQNVLRQVADDWTYFLADQGIDPTPARSETNHIWEVDGFKNYREVRNRNAYTGFLIYVSGLRHEEMRAGGTPTLQGNPQTSNGRPLNIRRSGTLNFDVRGNWHQMGWRVDAADENWWVSGNLRQEPSDFYSIALHEMGHALAFEATYPVFGEAKKGNGLAEATLMDYLGKAPTIDASDHFAGTIDPVSGYGAFGMEYLGWMKARRWLVTKSHLLSLQAIGYKLRPFPYLKPFKADAGAAQPGWRVGRPNSWQVAVTGGVPDYSFRITKGALPAGLELNGYTGAITGTPTSAGVSQIELEIRDQDPTSKPITQPLIIRVERD